jgi:hypothetical protein
MKNIDLEIYRTQIEQGVDFKAMADEFQLDENEIKETFMEELLIVAEENIIDGGDPTLDEEQFVDCMMATEIKIHLRNLIAQGLIQGDVDVESGENVYSLTNKGRSAVTNI